jgi:iron complex outermembrane receptor protein
MEATVHPGSNRMAYRPWQIAAALAGASVLLPAAAEEGEAVETVTIISTTPVPGIGIDRDKVPGNGQSLSAADIARSGEASATRALSDQLGSVGIDDNLDDPFQPDLHYRGFVASPVLGTPQGLAVYQNGVRINEAFGDTANWDLLPDFAIDRIDVMSANPVYGLNALGGAVVLTMKNGFTYEGGEAEISGGAWSQRQLQAQYGMKDGAWGAYVAGRALEQGGWRDFSRDSVRQGYAALSYRADGLSLDLGFTGANNRLGGQSATPVQELAVSRSSVFTTPQININQLEFVTLDAGYSVNDRLSVQATSYYREFRQSVVNGNTTNYTACASGQYSGYLCQADAATPLTGAGGAFLPDISQGGALPIGENDMESLRSVSVGGSLQATSTYRLFGLGNHLAAGGSVDSAATSFHTSTEVGVIDPALRVTYSGLFVDTPQGTGWTATPVNLSAGNRYYGLFASDSLDLTDNLTLTLSGRYNVAEIDLTDRLGTALNGNSRYSRFNPAFGFTEKLSDTVTAFFGYAENNRAPTPGEIECSNPLAPCLLPSSLSSDPPNLRQVVSHSFEAGLRGAIGENGILPGSVTWNAALFRTDVDDDIYGVATSLSTGYFQNIGGTRRQGAELGLRYRDGGLSAFLSYSFVDATFRSALTVPSPSNPYQDANGNIQVAPGDRLPGIPRHRLKAGADYPVARGVSLGGSVAWIGSQVYRGDEANLLAPLPGYAVVNLHGSWELGAGFTATLRIDNALNAKYATFGVLGDPTGVGAPGIPVNGVGVDNRFQSPAPPISVFGGVRMRF